MRKKKIPLASATAVQLKKLGLKKKTFMLPIDIAEAIEAQSEIESTVSARRTEAQIMADAFRGYRREFNAFVERVAEKD